MNKIDFLASEISLRYCFVKRARNCFLYTQKGVRLTDMYQEGGRAILGWGGGAPYTVFKNTLNRGITGSFDTEYSGQLKNAVSKLLASDREILLFSQYSEALKASLSFSSDNTSVWKPWNQENINWQEITSVVIAPPLSWAESIYIVAVKSADLEVMSASGKELPSTQRLPAPLVAAVTRAIYDMIEALQNRSEKDWFIYDTVLAKYWKRKGPYLYPIVNEDSYGRFILHCLDCGLVISPDYNVPSIVPFGADKGVFTKLKNTPFVL